ncbi:hypothetical protein GCM10023165_25680 [Variovorax defluvii]|uniref:Uncharacterized protein n=1 Tax=Variovorax defluvii TaxID=913761 RepID=A0ABP8HRQ0_9BURK
MFRHPPHRHDDRPLSRSHERHARESDSPVPARPAQEGEPQQSPGAKPLVKKQQQQH